MSLLPNYHGRRSNQGVRSRPDPAEREVGEQPVGEEHGDERGDAGGRAGLAAGLLRREEAGEAAAVLHGDEQPVAVVGEGGVLGPRHEPRHVVDVEAAGEEVGEHDDGDERGGALGVHHDGADGEAEPLGDEHVGEDHGERERERGRRRVEPGHEVDDDGERGGERELHGEVARHARHEVGRERVHPRRALPRQHGPLLREREHGVEGGEHAPEDGDEEEEPHPVAHRRRRRPPPHGPRHQRRRDDLEQPQRRERLVPPLLEAPPQQDRELVRPARAPAAALRRRRRWLLLAAVDVAGVDGRLHPRREHSVVRRDQRLLHVAAIGCVAIIILCLSESCIEKKQSRNVQCQRS